MGLFDSSSTFDLWPSVGVMDTSSSASWSPSTGGSWSDVVGNLTSAASSVTGIAKGVADTVLGWQTAQAQIDNAKQGLELQKVTSQAGIDIAKAQAAQAVQAARNPGIFGNLNADNISTALSNLNARITGQSSGGSGQLMLWLTVAGVGLAAMQYFKKRG